MLCTSSQKESPCQMGRIILERLLILGNTQEKHVHS